MDFKVSKSLEDKSFSFLRIYIKNANTKEQQNNFTMK